MADAEKYNFFALIDDSKNRVRRIPVTQELQQEMSSLFDTQRENFLSGLEKVRFSGSYKADESELFYIENYSIPTEIWEAIRNPADCQILNLSSHSSDKIKGIFTGSEKDEPFLSFQVFDRRRLLSATGFNLIISGNTFKRLEDPGLILDDKLTALYADEQLYFMSYFFARRILDLAGYYRMATNNELSGFTQHSKVWFEDPEQFLGAADEWTRRKIAFIQDNGILDQVTPKRIASVAKKFGITLSIKKEGQEERLTFPAEKKALKEILRFLDEDYYVSTLRDRRYVSNSKRPVEALS